MRILIADDHTFSLLGTRTFVESLGYEVISTCDNGITAVHHIATLQPDIAILDINMPGKDGIEVLIEVEKQYPATKAILMTMHNEMYIYQKALEHGAYGYLLKNKAIVELQFCLEEVVKGKKYISHAVLEDLQIIPNKEEDENKINLLSLTEKKILEFVVQQKTSKQIGDLLFISERTVEGHRTNIIRKLNLPQEKNILLIWAMKHFH